VSMRSIAVMNQKGGVGKTTTSVNLAAALARRGKRVLLIDMDPQAHASLHLGLEPTAETHSIYDVLTRDDSLESVKKQPIENLWVVPSDLNLAGAEVELTGVVGREFILRDKLRADPGVYDYLIFDCPPSLGVLTINVLAAAKEVFIPLQPHFLALHGLSKLLQTIELVRNRLNRDLRLTGIVFCLYDSSTTLAREISGDVRRFFDEEAERAPNSPWADVVLYRTKIRRNIRLAEAPSFGESIFDYDPKSNGADDYADLAAEVDGGKEEVDARHKKSGTASRPGSAVCSAAEPMPKQQPEPKPARIEPAGPELAHPETAQAGEKPKGAGFFAPDPLPMETD
jgi:chromosome partitioning protein